MSSLRSSAPRKSTPLPISSLEPPPSPCVGPTANVLYFSGKQNIKYCATDEEDDPRITIFYHWKIRPFWWKSSEFSLFHKIKRLALRQLTRDQKEETRRVSIKKKTMTTHEQWCEFFMKFIQSIRYRRYRRKWWNNNIQYVLPPWL